MQSNDPAEKTKQWDFFISHASEDKEEIADHWPTASIPEG